MSKKSTDKSTLLWFLIGIVGGLIFIGWLIMLPKRLPEEPLNIPDVDEFQNIITDSSAGFDNLKSDLQEANLQADQLEAQQPPARVLTEQEIKALENRVFETNQPR